VAIHQNLKMKINGMIGCKVHMEKGRIFKRSGIYWSSIHTYFSLVQIYCWVL